MEKLNITWCYPDILSLHGDRGNIMALKKVAEMLNIEVEINRIDNYDDLIDFKKTDILLFNPGELKTVPNIIEALKKQIDDLKEYVNKNKVLIVIGTTGAAFGKEIVKLDSTKIEGLGLLDMVTYERENILGDDLIIKLKDNDIELNGSQIQVIDTKLDSNIELAKVEYGYGNNGYENKLEGAKNNNLIFTNMLGPLFVKNPWYAELLIKKAMENKKVNIKEKISKESFDIEYKSLEAIKKYNEEK